MIKKAMEYIKELAAPVLNIIDEQTYSNKDLIHITQPRPDAIKLVGLDGLVEFIRMNETNRSSDFLIVHVESYKKVSIKSQLRDDLSRAIYVVCEPELPQINFNTFSAIENFNIMIQSCFVNNLDKETVLKVVGNIVEEDVRTTGDDGISQEVTAKTGIAKKGNIVVPNPVCLIPYRTFIEVKQPSSAFVLRLKDGPVAALYEADGGTWKIEAMKSIKEYLSDQLTEDYPEVTIIA